MVTEQHDGMTPLIPRRCSNTRGEEMTLADAGHDVIADGHIADVMDSWSRLFSHGEWPLSLRGYWWHANGLLPSFYIRTRQRAHYRR